MMNTSLRVFQINASGKIVEISRQSSLESGTIITGCHAGVPRPGVPSQTQDGNCSQEVSMRVTIIPHGSEVSHTRNNAPMILRKGSKMVASGSWHNAPTTAAAAQILPESPALPGSNFLWE